MNGKLLKLFWGVTLLGGILFLNSCQDKDLYEPGENPPTGNDTPSTLDFSTSAAVEMDFNYNVVKGLVTTYDIYGVYPLKDGILRSDITPIASGIAVAGTPVKGNLPRYATDLYLYTPNLFVPNLSHAKVENGKAVFSQMDVKDQSADNSRSARSIGDGTIDLYLKQPSDFYATTGGGVFENDLINPDETQTIPSEVLSAIGTTFPERVKADPKFYTDAIIDIVKDNDGQGVHVYISVIHAGGQYNNSLSYFTYTGNKEFKDFTPEERDALKIINVFKYADVNTNSFQNKNKGLTPGKYAQLLYFDEEGNVSEEFPVGTKIGWVLHSNAYNGLSNEIKTKNEWIYSVSEWNPIVKGTKNRTIFFETKDNQGNPFNCFGFEDQPSYDQDCNDVIFHVLTNPVDAIVPPPSIEPEDIEKEEVKTGILAFEDLWPGKGDYDLNDVVVKYHSTIKYVQEVQRNQETGAIVEYGKTNVTKLTDIFTMVHTGAEYDNSFYYKMNIDPSIVKSIKIKGDDDANFKNYTMVPDGKGFIVELCPNITSVIDRWDYNTKPYNYTVEVEFDKGVLLEDAYKADKVSIPYNPFIVPNKTPGVEVHLPNYPPTSRVDYDLFGTNYDHSDKNTIWYVGGKDNLYPFAIHLTGVYDNFVVPMETKNISVTYPDYTKWVESNMSDYQDWYLNPVKK